MHGIEFRSTVHRKLIFNIPTDAWTPSKPWQDRMVGRVFPIEGIMRNDYGRPWLTWEKSASNYEALDLTHEKRSPPKNGKSTDKQNKPRNKRPKPRSELEAAKRVMNERLQRASVSAEVREGDSREYVVAVAIGAHNLGWLAAEMRNLGYRAKASKTKKKVTVRW